MSTWNTNRQGLQSDVIQLSVIQTAVQIGEQADKAKGGTQQAAVAGSVALAAYNSYRAFTRHPKSQAIWVT